MDQSGFIDAINIINASYKREGRVAGLPSGLKDIDKKIISIFPGSRLSEINVLMPILIQFIQLMENKYNDFLYVFHVTQEYKNLINQLRVFANNLKANYEGFYNTLDSIVYNEQDTGWGFGSGNASRTEWSGVKEDESEWGKQLRVIQVSIGVTKS